MVSEHTRYQSGLLWDMGQKERGTDSRHVTNWLIYLLTGESSKLCVESQFRRKSPSELHWTISPRGVVTPIKID